MYYNINSSMACFIGYIKNKNEILDIFYFTHIAGQITGIILEWFRVFIHDCGVYKYQNARFLSLHINFILCKILKTTTYLIFIILIA